jgi:sodium pump decarboxylase gamma subunit
MWKLLGEGAKFSLIAQTMVFLVLFLLALVILAMKFIFYRPNKENASQKEKVPQEPVEPEEPEEAMRVAAIAAALEMHRQAGIEESPPIIGQEGPWAPRQGRAVMSQGKSRRWSHG